MSIFRTLMSPTISNSGSTARDHLASERTFLAWLRTGLGFIALGIAVERFSQLQPAIEAFLYGQNHDRSKPVHSKQHAREASNDQSDQQLLVAALLGTGAGSIGYGTWRYFSNFRHLERGLFKPALLGPAAMSAVVAGIAGGVTASAMRDRRRLEEAGG
ncbi:hypothetical protein LTS18_009048 [Coniosporium uncinatum]|uniref:Uncharacterized protein n=1 Tax=Coniosporium uncinatum TaxID=93489 RepID=A0ACC3DMD8_9PEZI|nr:hypothetical protein LTS18_009048 [Coniosporium uncinatum]